MNIKNESGTIYQLPKFEELSPYWSNYFQEIDKVLLENFWGNLSTLKSAEQHNDVYITQQKEMGYCFDEGIEAPASFFQSMSWVFEHIHRYIVQGIISVSEVLWPARVFEVIKENGIRAYVFKVIGEEPPHDSLAINLVTPALFVDMLANGFFPLGTAIREHTNQCLAEHDLAHFGGFISSPAYMGAIRKAFQRVCDKIKNNHQLRQALDHYDSVYSLRLYYMIEVFTLIPETNKQYLQELLELNTEDTVDLNKIITFLENKAKNPANLYRYLYRIYEHFYQLVNPVGGESRDIINRVRKFNRSSQLGTFYSEHTNLNSKFNGSSIYSMYLNGKAALENKRSSHTDFIATLCEIHAPFIGALIGTSQLTVEDWVLEAVEELPNPQSKLYRYLCNSGIWNESHLIYWAYGCFDYTRIVSCSTLTK
jgi:hypothetical protein